MGWFRDIVSEYRDSNSFCLGQNYQELTKRDRDRSSPDKCTKKLELRNPDDEEKVS
jgi:hypothetical protein